ncbi:MAG: glycosyltransferase family A protein [Deltaproteobacteria bacterium]|nr:glycosyltransferase family A protein [Deltaproteobacteria bacterium]
MIAATGCVAIGRNEGERLERCLRSLARDCDAVVYVDSGSRDNSVAFAQAQGARVVNLDLSRPFTAARARNEGWRALLQQHPQTQYIQFLDGDCEMVDGWLAHAKAYLDEHPEVAVVCGRRRERYPERSVYNRLCDQEWDTPVGEALACGGDALFRRNVLEQVGGYRDDLIAGEEPELCVRIRQLGHKVVRLDAEMTLHDAAMTEFAQWWKRTVRAGHAFAEGAALHGNSGHFVRETRRACFWGAVLPAVAVTAALPTLGASLALFAGYPVTAFRSYKYLRDRGQPLAAAVPAAGFLTLGKFAEAQGALKFYAGRLFGRRSGLIEYK